MTYKSILLQSFRDVKKTEHKRIISDALNVIKENPELGVIKITQSIDSMSYFFLNHLEKDFIGYKNTYSFYKGFRSVFRGMNIHYYNKKCVYRRGRGAPFTLIDFLNGKINCGKPIGYPRGVNKNEIIRGIEKSLRGVNKVTSGNINSFELGKKLASFFTELLIPSSYALSEKAKKRIGLGSAIGIVVGVMLIAVGFMFTPTAGIGIPVIAGGCALIAAGLGWNIGEKIHQKVKKRRQRNRNPDGGGGN